MSQPQCTTYEQLTALAIPIKEKIHEMVKHKYARDYYHAMSLLPYSDQAILEQLRRCEHGPDQMEWCHQVPPLAQAPLYPFKKFMT